MSASSRRGAAMITIPLVPCLHSRFFFGLCICIELSSLHLFRFVISFVTLRLHSVSDFGFSICRSALFPVCVCVLVLISLLSSFHSSSIRSTSLRSSLSIPPYPVFYYPPPVHIPLPLPRMDARSLCGVGVCVPGLPHPLFHLLSIRPDPPLISPLIH
jgi:hypothetical protein